MLKSYTYKKMSFSWKNLLSPITLFIHQILPFYRLPLELENLFHRHPIHTDLPNKNNQIK